MSAVALAVALAGCERDVPTRAEQPGIEASAAPNTGIAPGRAAELNLAIDDASSRLVASLSDAVVRARLDGHLRDLSTHLASGNATKARRALSLARKALAELDGEGDAPDIAAIGLALDQVERDFDARTDPEVP